MSDIEKMRRYIERTKMSKNNSYQMNMTEALDLAHATEETPIDIVCLAFDYGKAKGYRAAKVEGRVQA